METVKFGGKSFRQDLQDFFWTFLVVMVYLTIGPVARRRYTRWIVATWRGIGAFCVAAGDYGINVALFKGGTGPVHFHVDEEDRDGYLVLRQYAGQRMVVVNYRCENRWVTRKARPKQVVLNQIMSAALGEGYYVAYLYWGEERLTPYYVPNLRNDFRQANPQVASEHVWTREEPKSDKRDPLARYQPIIERVT